MEQRKREAEQGCAFLIVVAVVGFLPWKQRGLETIRRKHEPIFAKHSSQQDEA